MNEDLAILKAIEISSSPSKVWHVLTDPEMIKQYFTGAETITDWHVGSEVIFSHVYEGKAFQNRGVIIDFNPGHLLSYTYWTAFSNTEDKPENYTLIVYTLTEMDKTTTLTLKQTNFQNIEWYFALQTGWDTVLSKINELAER